MNLGKSIKELRLKMGYNQDEFSTLVNMSQAYLSAIECGKKIPSTKAVEKISEFTEIPAAVIYFKSLDENDVIPSKRKAFEIIKKPLNTIIDGIW